MTETQFFEKIWPRIFTVIALVNPLVGVGQLWSLISSKRDEGVSFITFLLMWTVVTGFAIEGRKNKTPSAMWSMAAASVITAAILILLIYFRRVVILTFLVHSLGL